MATRRKGVRGLRVLVLALLACGWVLLSTGPAAAHAVLVGTDPAYGVTVDSAPERVAVRFDEAVTAVEGGVTVVDREGRRADSGAVEYADAGRTVTVALRSDLPEDTYLVSWVVLSADGHTVSGSSVFGVGVPPDLTLGEPARDPVAAVVDTVVRLLALLGYAGIVLAVGVPVIAAAVWREGLGSRAVAQLVRVGAVLVAVAAALTVAAIPARLTGADGWADPGVWGDAAGSSLGLANLVRLVAAVALALWWPRRAVAVASGVVLVVATAASGHAVSGDFRSLAVFSTAVHVLAMAVWVGGLLSAVLVWRDPRRTQLLARFSGVALGAVAVLAVTGIFQAWRGIDPLPALWTTTWGRLLLLKLALVALALGAAVTVRRAGHGRALKSELALQTAVLAVTAALAGVTPARDAYDPPTTLRVEAGPLLAEVAIDGAGAGEQEWTVRLRDAHGTPVEASALAGRLTAVDNEIGPIEVAFRRVDPVELGPHYFVADTVRVPLPGEWKLRLTVSVDRTTAYAATTAYRVE